MPEGEEEEDDDDDDDDDEEEEEEEEDEVERYGSKPAKRPRSDFVIEEAGQLNVILVLLTHSTYIDVYARNYPIIIINQK